MRQAVSRVLGEPAALQRAPTLKLDFDLERDLRQIALRQPAGRRRDVTERKVTGAVRQGQSRQHQLGADVPTDPAG